MNDSNPEQPKRRFRIKGTSSPGIAKETDASSGLGAPASPNHPASRIRLRRPSEEAQTFTSSTASANVTQTDLVLRRSMMKLDELAIVASTSKRPPRSGMIRHRKSSGAQHLFLGALRKANNIWFDTRHRALFAELLPVVERNGLGKRLIKADIEIRIGEDPGPLTELARRLVDTPRLSNIVHDLVTDVLVVHFNGLDNSSFSADPIFPARVDCENELRRALEQVGLLVEAGPHLKVVPHIGVEKHISDRLHTKIVPTNSGRQQPLDLIITLTAPLIGTQNKRQLVWMLNEKPMTGGSDSVEMVTKQAVIAALNNAYTVQQLRREPGNVARDVSARVDAEIGERFGFNVTVNIIDGPAGEGQSGHTGSGTEDIRLIGTGRTVSFEIEYSGFGVDDDLLSCAFEAAQVEASNKKARGHMLTPVDVAAHTGGLSAWIDSMIMSAGRSALKKAVMEVPIEKLPGLGAFPEDTSLRLDKRINAIAKTELAGVGLEVQFRVLPLVDPILNGLRNGIQADTDMQNYELAQTSIKPRLRFQFGVKLPKDASMELLNPFFQERDPLAAIASKAASCARQVAAKVLGQLSPDAYLDTTGNVAGIRDSVARELDQTLHDEFRLALHSPLVVTIEPDRVQQRYDELRSETRRIEITLHLRRAQSGDSILGRLTLQYQVDRLANPYAHGDPIRTGAIDSWERFRTWAARYETLGAHLDAFDNVMRDATRAPLEQFPAEAFAKTELRNLQPEVEKHFAAAGQQFGLNVRVIPGTVNVDFDDVLLSVDPRLASERERLEGFIRDQKQDQKRLDDLLLGGASTASNRKYYDDEDDFDEGEDGEDEFEIVQTRMNKRKVLIEECFSNMDRLTSEASLARIGYRPTEEQ